MKFGLLLTLVLLISACGQVPLRGPASIDTDHFFGDVDPGKSLIKVFPPEVDGKNFKHYFYLELKNRDGSYVDAEEKEFSLTYGKDQKIPFRLERMLRGRYYLTIEKWGKSEDIKINLVIQKKPMQKELKLLMRKADRNKSSIKLVRTERSGMRLRLFLGDSKGRPVEIPSVPEIIIEGQAQAENLEHVGEGVWEFDLIFPNSNQIIYVSVRAHGAFMNDMFRVQHIEK